MLKRIHHLAFVAKDFDTAIEFFEKECGVPREKHHVETELDRDDFKVLMIKIGETTVEIMKPTREDSPLNKIIKEKGEGFHHIAFEVEDIEKAAATLQARGLELVDKKPRRGIAWRTMSIDPKCFLGLRTQIVEPT